MIALIVTLACLPLLVIDMLQSSPTSSATESASSSDSSLVVAAVPSTEDTTTTTVVVVATDIATSATTVAPVATTVPRPVQTTTTTAPAPVVISAPAAQSDDAFLACVRNRESHNDYAASDSSGTFLGAYQIYQGGWDSVASRIGREDLVGIPPNQASPSDQDAIAKAMLQFSGRAPWGGSCR